ncbi:MAG: signal recognition particle-docking protein FtsY [Kangiellaceae bacterium]|jgi:fused signal recognition particle receptor|nr:signal recognition particle-docking protein FtsY [Kangiellaceae bacterium]
MSSHNDAEKSKESGGLFGWFSKKPADSSSGNASEGQPEVIDNTQEKPSFFKRLKNGLAKTRSGFSSGLASLVLGQKHIDDDLLEEIETQLLMADVGIDATQSIIDDLTEKTARKELKDSTALMNRLKQLLNDLIAPVAKPLEIDTEQHQPYVILMVGINGVGKTTTIGKLAKQLKDQGLSVMLAAGDTFRAAAVEQLQVWGKRNDIPVVAQHEGADSASVIFDAIESAKAKGVDVLIADTAGRLHTKSNLMDELAKVTRVMQKVEPTAPHETMLVVDAGTGQNAINQAEQFDKAVGLSGITLTKLDGTAKGGVVFALSKKMSTPIRFIGVGEGIEDLRPFDANDFIEALFEAEAD